MLQCRQSLIHLVNFQFSSIGEIYKCINSTLQLVELGFVIVKGTPRSPESAVDFEALENRIIWKRKTTLFVPKSVDVINILMSIVQDTSDKCSTFIWRIINFALACLLPQWLHAEKGSLSSSIFDYREVRPGAEVIDGPLHVRPEPPEMARASSPGRRESAVSKRENTVSQAYS